jgi:hypothetical protein
MYPLLAPLGVISLADKLIMRRRRFANANPPTIPYIEISSILPEKIF